ncbi:hypothetical protein PCS_01819 [Desulfocurvibacter africanus PCS]|uniref:Uncharacterized protein n=1 Tax=Desulfocurvibacter africanus PCS TaxID=1262666 RepID=M5Q2C6_DESAF|nr:hypothetical protein [Desulfocurvibacter africanus]EMG37308.1 hypothetical protein PCS_01819 [Desulfocurvibacter africanus PCS]
MHEVTLRSDGILLEAGKEAPRNTIAFLSSKIVIEDGVQLKGFFRMLEAYPLLGRLNNFLPMLLKLARAAEPHAALGLNSIVLTRTVEMIGFPGKPRLEIYTQLMGQEGDRLRDLRHWALESLLELPLRLGRLRHIVFGDRMDMLEFETTYTLFDFIEGVSWELSFLGTSAACEIRRN